MGARDGIGARLGRVGRLLRSLLLPLFQLLAKLGRWLWASNHRVLLASWRFLGRLGLALRKLLTWFIYRPLHFLIYPFFYLGKLYLPPVWRFLGRMGLALRRLLAIFVWRPVSLVTMPLRWLLRPLARLLLRVRRWCWQKIRAVARRRWEATAPGRKRFYRRLASRWTVWRARWRVFWRRPSPPQTAVSIPRVSRPPHNVRLLRFSTALLSLAALAILGFAALQEQQANQVAAIGAQDAEPFLPRIIRVVVTPTPGSDTPAGEPTPTLRPWPTPDPLTDGGTLAFSQRLNGNNDIYLLPVGQSQPVRLTAHPAADRDPAWRPDGEALAFSSRRDGNWEVYVYDLRRNRLTPITDNPAYDGAPRWSPDGQWLVYESYRNGNMDVYIVKADRTEGPFRLTEDDALDYAPDWSPGGRHVVFTSWRSGNPDIFLLSLDEVSDVAAMNLTRSPDRHEDGAVFAPNGRFLAYHETDADFPLLSAIPLNQSGMPDGRATTLNQQGQDVAWSPTGESLVYVHRRGERHFLMAGSADAWGVAPQTFASEGKLSQPSWTAVTLPPGYVAALQPITPAPEAEALYVEAIASPDPDAEEPQAPVKLFELPVNAPSPYLSDRVDQSFQALRERIITQAGWDFLGRLDQMFVALDAGPLPGQPAASWNKAGRAFDLDYQEAMAFEPRVEVVREDVGADTYWRVYLRTSAQDGSQGEPLRQLPWDFRARFGEEPQYFDDGGKLKEAIPAGYYLDFTALAADYGWQRVSATANWRTYFPGINFWHFEKRDGLSWAEAMREIYTPGELQGVVFEP